MAPPVDSAAVRDAARAAQEAFERLRWDHLPTARGGSGGHCDEIVGRFCFWHGGDDDWVPPPEHPRVRAGRDRLLVQLDTLARLTPGDDWTVGQRVRYLTEAGRLDEGARTASECRGSPWWCLALAGYVHHAAQRYAAADSAFAAATARMPEADRCAWKDLSLVLDRVPPAYRRESCGQRATLEERIWWLADPLFLTPGNERRTEHYARRVQSRFQDDARSGYAVRWGDDLDELLIRYGWPAGWERDVSRRADRGGTSVISHHTPRSREFLPPSRFVEDPSTMALGNWDMDPARPQSGYTAAYAQSFDPIENPQVAVFRRGDSAVVVAAFEVLREMEEYGGGWRRRGAKRAAGEAALAFLTDPRAVPIMSRTEGDTAFRLAVTTPWRPGLLSLETIVRSDSTRALRARWWLQAPRGQNMAVSEPLLFDVPADDSLPATLEAVFPSVRTNGRAVPGERVGVYWETRDWGNQAVAARFALTVTRVGESWLRRTARALRLAGRAQPSVSLGWTEVLSDPTTIHRRSLHVGLPDGPGGAYELRVEVRVGEAVARAERRLVVAKDGEGW